MPASSTLHLKVAQRSLCTSSLRKLHSFVWNYLVKYHGCPMSRFVTCRLSTGFAILRKSGVYGDFTSESDQATNNADHFCKTAKSSLQTITIILRQTQNYETEFRKNLQKEIPPSPRRSSSVKNIDRKCLARSRLVSSGLRCMFHCYGV